MATYPLQDGTNSKMVLYPAGVTSFNEDYQETETIRESDVSTRFNSIVKTAGIVAKKADISTKLFPVVVSGNQISISSGVGYTGNGAEINIESDLTIADITALTGYVAPSGTNSVYLVLRKYAQDYAPRPHPIKGTQHYTRRRIKNDSSIAEFIVKSGAEKSNAITDRDVVVLGRLSSVSPAVFDTTEKTGFRKILRVTETPTMETGILNIMENDIDLVNQYNILNSPQFGEQHYKLNGVVNNKDFQRLIAKTTSQLSVLRGVKFQAVTGGYGIQFSNDDSIKIKIFPAQQPPQTVDVIQRNTQVPIPENYMLYITLSDAQLLITSGGGGELPIIEGDSAIGGGGVAGSFSTASISSSNLGTTVGSNLRKFPICWHYYNAVTQQRALIFLDGTILNLNDEVTTEGYHSAYLRRAGTAVANNHMTDNLEIRKSSGKVIFTQGSGGVLVTDISTGLEWRKEPPFNSVVIGEFKRFISGNTGGEDAPPSGIESYDFYLNAFDNDGLNGKSFVFKKDGRLQIDTPARDPKDALRLNEGFDKRGDDVPNNTVTGNITIGKDNPQLILQDTTTNSGFQGIQIKKADGGGIGYFERESASGTDSIFTDGWDSGDWLWATTDNNGLNGKGVRLSVNTGHLAVPKLLVQTDGTISGTLRVYGASGLILRSVGDPSGNLNTYRHSIFSTYYSADEIQLEAEAFGHSLRKKLINLTDSTSIPAQYTVTNSLASTGVAVELPKAKTSLIIVNVNGVIERNEGSADTGSVRLTVVNNLGTTVHAFATNWSVTGNTSTSFGCNSSFVYNSENIDSLALYASFQQADSDNTVIKLKNDGTGYTNMSAVVLN